MDLRGLGCALSSLEEQIRLVQGQVLELPLGEVVFNTLQLHVEAPKWQQDVLPRILFLIEQGLIFSPIRDRPITLGEWLSAAEKPFSAIRLQPHLNQSEQEKQIEAYQLLLQAIQTRFQGLVSVPVDPMRCWTTHKTVPYDLWIELADHLSSRDRFAIALLYFGSISPEILLRLKVGDFQPRAAALVSGETVFKIPGPLVDQISVFLADRAAHEPLLSSGKGQPLTRAHLNGCLLRARPLLSKSVTLADLCR